MKKIYLFLFLISLNFISFSQNPGDIAQNFGALPGFNNAFRSAVKQSDTKIVMGGYFTSFKGVTENYIIRLNNDGSKDTSFNTGIGFNDYIESVALQSDGKILIGGNFTTYKGVTENRIIRLNSDGTKDSSFNTGTGFNNSVYSIAVQPDGKIIVAGDFTTYKGITENRIIRLNTDGSKDSSFNTGTGFNSFVSTIEVQTDGKIIMGGFFTAYKGVTQNKIIRLNTDGSKDTSFLTGTGFNNDIKTIITQPDGKIVVGGSFTNYKGISENKIIRLNADGSKDPSFITGTGFDNNVYSIAIDSNGKIIVGGFFISYMGITENRIIRLNTDGSKDGLFNTGTGFDGGVYSIEVEPDGKIIVGGVYITYKNEIENSIIRLSADGNKDTTYNVGTGFTYDVKAVAIQSDGKIIVGGLFTNYNRATENRIIRLNADGSKDSSFNTGTGINGFGFSNYVYAIVLQSDGKILVSGNFTAYNGATRNYIIRLNPNGSEDNTFITGNGFNNVVNAIALQPDGKILLGGYFTTYNGPTENKIIRLNADGSKDNTFNTGVGFNSGANTIVVQSDGKILVGGEFTTYNGVTENRIIRLNTDGSKDNSFATGTSFNNGVRSIDLQSDGKILVGGDFTIYNGITENKIIRLNPDGSKDNTFATGTGFDFYVGQVLVNTDGKILLGGAFTTYNGITENRIIRLNPDGNKDNAFITGTGFNGIGNYINSIVLNSEGKIFVGGNFTTYQDNGESAYLIALHSETSLSIENFTNSNIVSLYPNPVKDILNIDILDNTISSIKVYDLQGKLILEDTNTTINVNHLSNGIYIVKVVTEEGEFTKKFIKE